MTTKTLLADAGEQYFIDGQARIAAVLEHLDYLEAQLRAESSWKASLKFASAQILASAMFALAILVTASALRNLPLP